MAHPVQFKLPNALTALGGALAFTLLASGPSIAQEAGDQTGGEAPAAESAANGGEMTRGERVAAEAAERLAAGETDEMSIGEAPEPNAHRVYITDPAHFAPVTQHFVIDADAGEVITIFDGGFLPHPLLAYDGSFFAQASTVFSRIARGDRTDYVEVLDPVTFEPTADIELPEDPRFLIGTYPWFNALTPDNSKVLFQMFSPSPAVGVVDLEGQESLDPIDVGDCYHIFPVSEDSFFMHCRDGSLAKVTFGDGEPTIENTDVFHDEDEYLVNQPAYSITSGRLVWPTYTGKIYQMNLSADGAEFLPEIEALTEEERADGWAPGGWQQTAYHRELNRIYLLVDQRGEWRHKTPSRYIAVIDADSGERIDLLDLGLDIDSINLSQDDEPLLYALSSGDQTLYILDHETGEVLRSVDQLGHGPQIITVSEGT